MNIQTDLVYAATTDMTSLATSDRLPNVTVYLVKVPEIAPTSIE